MNEDIKNFYNKNPFPLVSNLGKITVPVDLFEKGSIIKNIKIKETPNILIIGCGLVATKVIAEAYPSAKVICAVDISDKTIELAKKSISNTKYKNVKWYNLDLEDVLQLSNLPVATFDWIHCTGVLHHLSNPDVGLKNISNLLADDGVIRFQVYSKGARTWIEWLRKLLLSKNVENSAQAKEILLALSKFHPFRHTLATYNNSYKANTFNDAFLNPNVKTYYASGWNKLFNDAGLGIYHWENINQLNDYQDLLPQSIKVEFEKLSIDQKITFYEILGEWRSDFNGYACKNSSGNTYNDFFHNEKMDYYIEETENYSYPRYFLWQEFKSALQKLTTNYSKDEIVNLIDNLAFREWLPGFGGILNRLYWFALRDESRFLASNKLIFKEKQAILLEDFFDNKDQIYIPSPERWPWKQWDNGFFAWEW